MMKIKTNEQETAAFMIAEEIASLYYDAGIDVNFSDLETHILKDVVDWKLTSDLPGAIVEMYFEAIRRTPGW